MLWKEHTFVICAYGESPYLEACIRSLKNQRVESGILMVSSTPNDYIKELAEKYGIPFLPREGSSSLAGDWNFAYAQAKTPYVTLAHQDDVYGKSYLQEIFREARTESKALLLFTDYSELRGEVYEPENRLLKIKRLMLTPLKVKVLRKSIWVRRRILSLGNPICCPAVTYAKCNLPSVIFKEGFESNTDWEAWERISNQRGAFIYVPQNCMAHRIHEGSTTTKIIGDRRREAEDYAMFTRFWPGWTAGLIEKLYRKSEDSNNMGE